jgi:hypothetical protein
MAYVYRHIRLDKNEPFYIGIGSDKNKSRAYIKERRNTYWKNIVNKTDYVVEIMMDDLSWDEACKKEIEFIKFYGKYPNGCLSNMTDGGDGILGLKRGVKFSIRNSEIHKGKVYDEFTRKKMSNSHKGKALSLEHKKNISKVNKGKVLSLEHKKKIGKANKSIKHGLWKGYIYQYDSNGNIVNKFDTLHNAMFETKIDYRSISKVCSYYNHLENNVTYNYKKLNKTAGGFIWKRKNNSKENH